MSFWCKLTTFDILFYFYRFCKKNRVSKFDNRVECKCQYLPFYNDNINVKIGTDKNYQLLTLTFLSVSILTFIVLSLN